MKKLVNGKIYNTETAEKIANWSNSYYSNDFHYCEETLYKTKKGAYFLHGVGGALSKYSESCGNGSCGSSDIEPMTEEETFNWLERTGNIKEAQEEFPDMIQEA